MIATHRLVLQLLPTLLLLGATPLTVGETNAVATSTANGPSDADILTPKSAATPRITGPKVFGVRPGNPFLFKVTATGDKPMTFSADHLPAGLTLDATSGMITGTLQEKGTHSVTLHAKNTKGEDTRLFRIVCGDTISLTPALGWNSWNHFAGRVTEADVRGAADAMVSSGLMDHGWSYINIDDCWEGKRDTNGMIQSNEKFPDMKALADYIHSKGLKFGIYSSPGPLTCAKFEGSFGHEDQDAAQYGNWGVDYVKYDRCSYGRNVDEEKASRYATLMSPGDAAQFKVIADERTPLAAIWYKHRTKDQQTRYDELEKQYRAFLSKIPLEERARIDLELEQKPYVLFRHSLDKVKRDIIFSYCQYGLGNVWEWGEKLGGNSWRTGKDIGACWTHPEKRGIADIGFAQNGLEKYAGPGHWNDPDMLEIGNGRMTPEEQYTHMSLWALLASPLLIGCDMTKMSPFTVSLLGNDEVLDVNQDPLGKQAGRIALQRETQVWAKDLEDGSKAVGLFNLGEQPAKVTVTWEQLGAKGPQVVRDLWRQKNLGSFTSSFESKVPRHGVVLVKITPEAK
jgi:alpha-galactosidase